MHSSKSANVYSAAVLIAVVAVIALLAIPAWRNHTVRAHVADALKAADGAKLVVMEAATTQGGLARLQAANLAYSGSATNPYAAAVTIDAVGHIRVTTRNTGGTPDPVLELVPREMAAPQGPAPIFWTCLVVAGNADAAPENCHATAAIASAASTVPPPSGSAAR